MIVLVYTKPAKCKTVRKWNCFCYILFHYFTQSTVLAVLDTMMQPLEGEPNTHIVYYQILDGDRDGRAPNCESFDNSHKSCLHRIAKSNNKVYFISFMHKLIT